MSHTPITAEQRIAELEAQVASLRRTLKRHRANAEHVPAGYEPVEAYSNGKEFVVMGDPPAEEPGVETAHNCDALGCGSVGHVLARFSPESANREAVMRKALEDIRERIEDEDEELCDDVTKEVYTIADRAIIGVRQ